MEIIKRIRAGIFWKHRQKLLETQLKLEKSNELNSNYCKQIKILFKNIEGYKSDIEYLNEEIKILRKENDKLKQNQKKDGEYLVRKVPSGRPKKKIQAMNIKLRHYAIGTQKQLKELEENREK